MANQSEPTTQFATLFETITGQSTITEQQQIEVTVRYDERSDETAISEYLDTRATAQGFEDVIEESETY